MSGYARFHRSLIGHPAFRNDAEAMAFAYMVLRAAWRPVRVRYKGKALSLSRGQLAMSVRDLAEAMDRDKGWIERLLKRLRSETMVETLTETGVMVITICNYEKYQAAPDERETVSKTPDETPARQTQDTEQRREERKKEESRKEERPSVSSSSDDGLISDNLSPADDQQPSAEPDDDTQPLRAEEVVEAWNELAPGWGLATIRKLSAARRVRLQGLIKEYSLDDFRAALAAIGREPFLRGESSSGWKADFNFFITPAKFLKLLEGGYDRAPPPGGYRPAAGNGLLNAVFDAEQAAGPIAPGITRTSSDRPCGPIEARRRAHALYGVEGDGRPSGWAARLGSQGFEPASLDDDCPIPVPTIWSNR